jgi:prepilin-type N-terminal cleavage/methylation domain-containing protein
MRPSTVGRLKTGRAGWRTSSRESGLEAQRATQSGFSLIEVLLVIAIAAVFTMVGMPFVRGMLVESRIPLVVDDLALISHHFRANAAMALHQTVTPYTQLGSPTEASSAASRIASGRIKAMSINGTALTHELGAPAAAVVINQSQIVQMGDAFEITLQSVNRRACPALAHRMDRRVVLISINSVAVKSLGGSLNIADAEAACTDGDSNTFVFTFQ